MFSNVSFDRLIFLLISFLDLRKSVSMQIQILTKVRGGGGVSVRKGFIKYCVAGFSYDRKWGDLLGYTVRLEPADYMGQVFGMGCHRAWSPTSVPHQLCHPERDLYLSLPPGILRKFPRRKVLLRMSGADFSSALPHSTCHQNGSNPLNPWEVPSSTPSELPLAD